MPIRLLPDELASQIAAGEVVERPASVVKELIENALDAGARTITVSVAGGGRQLVQVADDGLGIPAADVELAFARHATSKIEAASDLFRIQTLGFRGEALASIASVSRVHLVTRARDEAVGTQLHLEGGAVVQRTAIGAPQGTVLSVENIFYNVPARLKFLKSETSERSQIAALLTRYALAYPAVRFKLVFDGRSAFQSSGGGDVRETLVAVYGVEIARQLIAIDSQPAAAAGRPQDGESPDAVRVGGFISPPALHRSNRRDITLFVNGRWVQDIRLSTAVLQAYHTLLMTGRFPLAVVTISLPAEDVDVNVHPAKAEVRFRSSGAVFSAVERTVRRALTEGAPVAHFEPRRWDAAPLAELDRRPAVSVGPEPGFAPEAARHSALAGPSPAPAAAAQPSLPAAGLPLLRTIGQVGTAFIVAEGPDGLYLIDQHAAHERVLYEAFSQQAASAQVAAQALLEPALVELTAAGAALLNGQLDRLQLLGFGLEPFGGSQFLVRSLPVVLGKLDPARAIRTLVEDFEEDEAPLAAAVEARLIARVCKRAAVRAGQVLSPSEMTELVRQLERCQSPRTCPHGRPTMIFLSVDVLERQFGRKG